MIKIRDGEMDYKNIEEIYNYFFFLGCCLNQDDVETLKKAWNKHGGYKTIPWWKFVMENTNVVLDIQSK